MNEDLFALIKYRLKRGRETLEDAKLLFEKGSYNSSINRIYYAVFYCVLSLLRTKNLMASKHSGVKALFHKEFVKSGEIPEEFGKFYDKIFIYRQQGDYEDYKEFTKQEVYELISIAESFIDFVERFIMDRIAK